MPGSRTKQRALVGLAVEAMRIFQAVRKIGGFQLFYLLTEIEQQEYCAAALVAFKFNLLAKDFFTFVSLTHLPNCCLTVNHLDSGACALANRSSGSGVMAHK